MTIEEAVRRFADARFDALAAAVVVQLKEMPASGLYGDVRNFQSVWDEYCYEVHEGPHESQWEVLGGPHDKMAAVWDPTLEPFITVPLEAVPDPEAVLLTIAAHWRLQDFDETEDFDESSEPLAPNIDLLCRVVRSVIDTLARERHMSEIEYGEGHAGDSWQLTEDDRSLLDTLRNVVRGLATAASSAYDLIAVGEAWQALDSILAGEPVEVNVELTLGFPRVNDDSSYETDFSLRVNDEEVRLSQMSTTWDKQIGSDHTGLDHAVLTPAGGFDAYGAEQWLDQFADIKSSDGVILSTSRDHA